MLSFYGRKRLLKSLNMLNLLFILISLIVCFIDQHLILVPIIIFAPIIYYRVQQYEDKLRTILQSEEDKIFDENEYESRKISIID